MENILSNGATMNRAEQLIKDYESKEGYAKYQKKCKSVAMEKMTLERLNLLCKHLIVETTPTEEKAGVVWEFVNYGKLPQNKVCAKVGISPRHYRDLRDKYEDEWCDYFDREVSIFKTITSEVEALEEQNEISLIDAVEDMRCIGIPGVEEWFNCAEVKEVDEFLEKTWAFMGGYNDDYDKWLKCKPLRYYITLQPDEQAKVRGN